MTQLDTPYDVTGNRGRTFRPRHRYRGSALRCAHVLLVEKHSGVSIFPKATGIRGRTMEIIRSWGLEDKVRARRHGVADRRWRIARHWLSQRRRSRSVCRHSV